MARSRSYAERVDVLKKVLVNGNWKFVPVLEKSGKIVRDHVVIAGHDEHHPEGSYYIEWYEGTESRRKESVGGFENVLEAARRKSIELHARKAGVLTAEMANQGAAGNGNGRVTKDAAIQEYLEYIQAHRSERTYKSYRYTLDTLLRNSYSKPYVDAVAREDIIKFMTFCYDRGLQARTVYDKLVVVLQFFKRNGKSHLIEPSDWPRYVETIRPIYEPEELEGMFRVATGRESVFLKFLLSSGFRDREARYVLWLDIDFRNGVVRVTAKPRWKFRPKNYEERVVPLPTKLMEQLQKLKKERNASGSELVFGNSAGNPNSRQIDIVKRVAQRAKLNCGQCETEHGNKCSEGPFCMRFFLHKFRHTFATEHLRHGVDIRTLQTWLGHRDIQSTMVYLKGVQSKDALAKVNGGSLAGYLA
jgi:integrase/recombinase XerD